MPLEGRLIYYVDVLKQTEEQIKLLRVQRKLEQDTNRQYLNLSLHATVANLVKENQHKWAEQLRKDFRIPDRRSRTLRPAERSF